MSTKESVQNYYGKELQSSSDLKTNACCTVVSYPDKIKKILGSIHDEVMSKYYGCGLTIPEELEGLNVLDLGSGSGRDCYLVSKLVGEKGFVTGVDMTDEQLAVANRHIDYHTEKFGYKSPNIAFKKGHIEKLDELDIADNSLDLIISNCVINLSTDKPKVLKDCFSKLKNGGEMYFSDVYVNKRIPDHLAKDEVIYGECLGGALYYNDFVNFAKREGFSDPRVVEVAPITIENKDLEQKLEGYEFYSITYRLFKIEDLELGSEDYGQAVIYKGSIEAEPDTFSFDESHHFEKGKVYPVSGNTYLMLNKSRYQKHFDFIGSFEKHFGVFETEEVKRSFSDVHQTGGTKSDNTTQSSTGSSCC